MDCQSSPKPKHSDFTPIVGGENLSAMGGLWREIAVSEMRLEMLKELRTLNVGYQEIEEFSLGLTYQFKSQKMKDARNEPNKELIKAAMERK